MARPRWMLTPVEAVLLIVVFLGRVAFGIERRVFSVYADEPATLAMARWQAGRVPWHMFDNATWKPGLSTFLAPVYMLTDDAITVYRVGLLINSAIGGVSAVVIARIARRTTGMSARACAWCAVAIALAPVSLFASAAVWAEPLVRLSFLAATLATMKAIETRSPADGFRAVSWASFGYFAHNRMLVMIPIVVAVVCVGLLRAGRRRPAALLASWAVLTVAAVAVFSRIVVRALWDDPTQTNTVGQVLRQLRSPLDVLDAGLGQIWYALVATGGLAALGAVALVSTIRDATAPSARRSDAAVIVALVVPQMLLSALFMANRPRADHLVYGRYNDAVLWPVVVIGVWWTWTEIRRDGGPTRTWLLTVGATVTAMLATGIAVRSLHGLDLEQRVTALHMVAGVAWLTPGRGEIHVMTATLVAAAALALGAALTASVRPPGWMVRTVAAAVLLVAGLLTRVDLGRDANVLTAAATVRLVDDLVPPEVTLRYRFTTDSREIALGVQRAFAQAFQFYLSDHEIVADDATHADAGPYVFAPEDDPTLVGSGAEVIYLDPRIGIALWREPTP